jgi:intergrase/recombinase
MLQQWYNLRYAFWRKIFATWLYRSGISEATINMVQGRCPPSILHQHYLASADNSLRRDVLTALEKLREKITMIG